MLIYEILTILSFAVLVAILFFLGAVIFILKKGFNEIITGMENISQKLEELNKSSKA